MNSWRLVSNIIAIVYKSGSFNFVAISGVEKKEYIKMVKNKLKNTFGNDVVLTEVSISSENIKIKFNKDKKYPILISSSQLPGNDYYYLTNFDTSMESILSIVLNSEIKNGIVSNNTEFVLNSEEGLVRLVHPGIPQYSKYKAEFLRRMNCEIYKKTTKWIPGHRYDKIDETLIYLGPVKSHSASLDNTEFHKDSFMSDSMLVLVGEDIEGCVTVEDAVKKSIKSWNLRILSKPSLMVDCGEVLKSKDKFDYNAILEDLIVTATAEDNSIDNYGNILGLLKIENFSDQFIISDSLKKVIYNYLRKVISEDIIPKNWNRPQNSVYKICENNTLDENINNCINILIRGINDPNIKKQTYYKSLFEYFNIDISYLVKTELTYWLPESILNNYKLYSKYCGKMYDISKETEVCLRKVSSNYSIKEVTFAEQLISNKESFIYKIIKEIIEKVRLNYFKPQYYKLCNVGTIKNPKIYESFLITLNDIEKYYKEINVEMPENLKNDIMLNKFCQVIINIDKDRELI